MKTHQLLPVEGLQFTEISVQHDLEVRQRRVCDARPSLGWNAALWP